MLACRLFSLLTLAACITLTACSSIKSRIYDTDNYTSPDRKIKRLHGIPETVEVPTHVVIRVQETKYYKDTNPSKETKETKGTTSAGPAPRDAGVQTAGAKNPTKTPREELEAELAATKDRLNALLKAAIEQESRLKLGDAVAKNAADITKNTADIAKNAADIKELQAKVADLTKKLAAASAGDRFQLMANLTSKKIHYDIINKKELFTVDFKRPLSGSNKLELKFGALSDGQFLSSAKQNLTDTSIVDVTAMFKAVSAALPTLKGISDASETAAVNAQLSAHIIGIPETVAIEYFDIHQPNLEGRIQEFLNRHINNCNPGCCTLVPAPHLGLAEPALMPESLPLPRVTPPGP